MPWPARVVKDAARQRHRIGIAIGNNRFGLLRLADQTDGNHRCTYLRLDRRSKRHLVARLQRNLLARVQPTTGYMQELHATCIQRAAQLDALRQIPATVDPVGGGKPHTDRDPLRYRRPHCLEHLQGQPHAVVQTAAIVVITGIAQRRQELVQQVSMRGMQFDQLQADALGAPRCRDERGDDRRDTILVQLRRLRITRRISVRRRCHRDPTIRLVRGDAAGTIPGAQQRRLATTVAQLHPQCNR
jgi:hypothetical protein